jgi:hypothetical protein
MRADCTEFQFLQCEYEDISKAYLALCRKIQADDTAKNNPERAAALNQEIQYVENTMADLADAIRQHEAEVHSDLVNSLTYAAQM